MQEKNNPPGKIFFREDINASMTVVFLAATSHSFHHVAHWAGSHDALHHLAGSFELLEELVYLWE
jgi:hypothetical protein